MFINPAFFSILKGTDCKQLRTAWPMSFPSTRVPVFTFGISPYGPRILATFITVGSIEVVARHRLNSGRLPSIKELINSSPPTTLAPAFKACWDWSTEAKTRIEGRRFRSSGFGKFRTLLMPLDLNDIVGELLDLEKVGVLVTVPLIT